jgi:hypothetical protein
MHSMHSSHKIHTASHKMLSHNYKQFHKSHNWSKSNWWNSSYLYASFFPYYGFGSYGYGYGGSYAYGYPNYFGYSYPSSCYPSYACAYSYPQVASMCYLPRSCSFGASCFKPGLGQFASHVSHK